MPEGLEPEDSGQAAPTKLSLSQRMLLALPRVKHDREKAPLTERVKRAMLKPEEPGAPTKLKAPEKPLSVEELEEASRYADDKERLVGLLAAPFAAMIGLLIGDHDIQQARPAVLSNGKLNTLHASLGVYEALLGSLLALSVLMLVTAWFRKRMFLGMVMALYGLAVFNLRYWGFGVPFVMVGAWLLVRAYRFQRNLREATGDGPTRSQAHPSHGRNAKWAEPPAGKRYAPGSRPKRLTQAKPVRHKHAG